jgi:hypothetical protein
MQTARWENNRAEDTVAPRGEGCNGREGSMRADGAPFKPSFGLSGDSDSIGDHLIGSYLEEELSR